MGATSQANGVGVNGWVSVPRTSELRPRGTSGAFRSKTLAEFPSRTRAPDTDGSSARTPFRPRRGLPSVAVAVRFALEVDELSNRPSCSTRMSQFGIWSCATPGEAVTSTRAPIMPARLRAPDFQRLAMCPPPSGRCRRPPLLWLFTTFAGTCEYRITAKRSGGDHGGAPGRRPTPRPGARPGRGTGQRSPWAGCQSWHEFVVRTQVPNG